MKLNIKRFFQPREQAREEAAANLARIALLAGRAMTSGKLLAEADEADSVVAHDARPS